MPYTIFPDPYVSIDGSQVYFSVTSYSPAIDINTGEAFKAVGAIDLNMANKFYDKTLSQYLVPGLYDKYFVSTSSNKIVLASGEKSQ
jgi:hypothetical protein